MQWLRRYLPRSLLGRALTILAAPIILVQVIAIWIFFDNHVDAVTRNLLVVAQRKRVRVAEGGEDPQAIGR